MNAPVGFTPVAGGWGRDLPDTWEREAGPGLWHQVGPVRPGPPLPVPSGWVARVHTAAPWRVRGLAVGGHERRDPRYTATTTFDTPAAAAAWLAAHQTPDALAAALVGGSLVDPFDAGAAALDAVAVLADAGDRAAARAVLAGFHGLDADRADRAEVLAAAVGARISPAQLAPPDLAAVIALLTRLISADLGLARARRRARRWLRLPVAAQAADTLAGVVALVSPADRPEQVAAWQAGLERRRAALVAAVGGQWPAVLPGVAEDLPPVAPVVVPRPTLRERDFEQHAGFCPRGRPTDGRGRVDVFFDYAAFPVWHNGGGCMAAPGALGMSPELIADLWSWSRSHDRRAVPGGAGRACDAVARHEFGRLRLLAHRIEATTGLAAPVQRHRGRGDGSCPTPRCLGPA